ncbi:MAG: hypothetical protein LBO62_05770, partial [Endomicrobium sp.]|nr:hypothetical protein [Endomicrobium sp.]
MVKKYCFILCVCFIFLRGVAGAAVTVGNFNELQAAVQNSNNADIKVTADVLQFNANLFAPANSVRFNFESAPPSGKTLFSGGGLYSGFSFQNKSAVSFENMSFSQMSSQVRGAAFSLTNSSASFKGETGFYSNESQDMGGAFEIDSSSIVFLGAVEITSNSAKYSGGGFIASDNSTIKFGGGVRISANSSLNGGAFTSDAATVIFDAAASQSVFEKNTSSFDGGAFYASKSDIFFNGEILFKENSSGQYGGAGYFEYSTGVFTNAKFYSNSAGMSGGALYAKNSYIVIKSTSGQKSVFNGNTANAKPNALHAQESVIIFQTQAASSIELYDGLSADENSVLVYEGEGTFELYGDMSKNYGDLTIAALNGGSFNINAGGVLNAKTLTNAAGSKIDAALNGQADIIAARRLNNNGVLSVDLGDKIKVENDVALNGAVEIYADLSDGDFRKAAY